MRITFCFLFLIFILTPCISQEDSMAGFKSLLQYTQPSATDFGAMVAPEIFAVSYYPSYPQPDDNVIIRATVKSYSSIAGYKIKKVEIIYWKNKGKKEIKEMKPEDMEHGIYGFNLGRVKEGDEFFYCIRAYDDWGNVSIEILPEQVEEILIEDSEDSFLVPSFDIKKIIASYDGDLLRLCMELKDRPKRIIQNEITLYGIAVFGKDVRYRPWLIEEELNASFIASYLPYFNIQDIVPAGELFNLSGIGPKKEKKAEFLKEENKICFSFSPEIIREDYEVGLKIAGLTISASISPFAIKPMDATHVIMLYLGGHSFKVYKIP